MSDYGKTVAFLTSSMTIRLSRDIWSGIQNACNGLNINTICFTGELLYPEGYDTNQTGANIVYDFVDPSTIDGVIIYTADVGDIADIRQVIELCDSFGDIPIISISWELPGIPCMTIDNYSGMYSLVDHLVEKHGYRDIAFIMGPPENPEAVERLLAYKDVLHKHNIPLQEDLIRPGEFSRISGHEAVDYIYREKGVHVDAIVCADDETAFGVNEALHRIGVSVPEDVALTGFDNEDMSGVMNPPLTTVEQPLFRQGELALNTLVQIWAGEDPGELLHIPTELIIRSSCGCSERAYRGIDDSDMKDISIGVETTLHSVRDELLNLLRQISIRQDLTISKQKAEELIAALIETHDSNEDRSFGTTLWEILTDISKRGEFISPMQEVFSQFHKVGQRVLNSSSLIRFEKILHRARVMIGNIAERVNSFLRIDAVEKLINLGDINYVLNAHFSHENIHRYFTEIADGNFSRLGIKSFYLALYEDPEEPLSRSRLLFAWEDGETIYEEAVVYPTKEILPRSHYRILKRKNLVISPLFFDEDQYGFIIAETDPRDAMASDILSWQVSGALNRATLIRREEERRRELESSIEELKRTQKQLVEAEKMASLGNLVAGIAHEINTPIGAGVTYASFFHELTTEMSRSFAEGKITKSGLADYLGRGSEISKGLMINLNRAAELIRSFKEVAVDQASSEKRSFNMKSYVEEILLSLKNMISQGGHAVALSCPEDIEMKSYPGHISQIILNLLTNSITHAFPDGVHGEIEMRITSSDDLVELLYCDNGVGLSPEVQRYLYDPFFTTRRNEGGSGLGMNIVYNLVTQSLGGEIECESEPGEGVLFRIRFPRVAE